MRRRMVVMSLTALALFGRDAAAQDTARVGVAMGYPSSLGVIWQISNRIAVRPQVSFSHNTSETEQILGGILGTVISGNSRTEIHASTIGVDLSALFYVGTWDNVRAYVSPAYTYSHTSSEFESAAGPLLGSSLPVATSIKESLDGHGFRGTVGVQFTPHRRFAVYGETGFEYRRSESNEDGGLSSLLGTVTKNHTIGSRSGVGVILYF
jgi:hypothetical protein